MSHLFFALLIALLPLRGWVSDAMATEVVILQVQAQQQNAIKTIAVNAYEESIKTSFDSEATVRQLGAADCADHTAGSESHAEAAHCKSCSACQVCHTLALTAAPVGITAVFSLGTLPRAETAQFASAAAAQGQKPPIS